MRQTRKPGSTPDPPSTDPLQLAVDALLAQTGPEPSLNHLTPAQSSSLISALDKHVGALKLLFSRQPNDIAGHQPSRASSRAHNRAHSAVHAAWGGRGSTAILQLMAIADRDVANQLYAPSAVVFKVHRLCHSLLENLGRYWIDVRDTDTSLDPLVKAVAVRAVSIGQLQLWGTMLARLAAVLLHPAPAEPGPGQDMQAQQQQLQQQGLTQEALRWVVAHATLLLQSGTIVLHMMGLYRPRIDIQMAIMAFKGLADSQLLEHAARLLLALGPLLADDEQRTSGGLPHAATPPPVDALRVPPAASAGSVHHCIVTFLEIVESAAALTPSRLPLTTEHIPRTIAPLRRIFNGPCLQYYLGARALQAVCALDGGPSWGLRTTGLPLPWEMAHGSDDPLLLATFLGTMADWKGVSPAEARRWAMGPQAVVDIACRAAALVLQPPVPADQQRQQQRLALAGCDHPLQTCSFLLLAAYNAGSCLTELQAPQRLVRLWHLIVQLSERYHSRLACDAEERARDEHAIVFQQLVVLLPGAAPLLAEHAGDAQAALQYAVGPAHASLSTALGAGWLPAYERHLRSGGMTGVATARIPSADGAAGDADASGLAIDWLHLMAHGDERQVAALIATARHGVAEVVAWPLTTGQQCIDSSGMLNVLVNALNEVLLPAWRCLQHDHNKATSWQALLVGFQNSVAHIAHSQRQLGSLQQRLLSASGRELQHGLQGVVDDVQPDVERLGKELIALKCILREHPQGSAMQLQLQGQGLLPWAVLVHGTDREGQLARAYSATVAASADVLGMEPPPGAADAAERLAQVERLLVYAAAQWLPALAAAVMGDLARALLGGRGAQGPVAMGDMRALWTGVTAILSWVPQAVEQLQAATPGSPAAASWCALLRDMRVLQLLEALLMLTLAPDGSVAGAWRAHKVTVCNTGIWGELTAGYDDVAAVIDHSNAHSAPHARMLDVALVVLANLARQQPAAVAAACTAAGLGALVRDTRLDALVTRRGLLARARDAVGKALATAQQQEGGAGSSARNGSGPDDTGNDAVAKHVWRMPAPCDVAGLQPTCSFFGCVRLEGRSEAGVALQACGRCGRAHYCCRACQVAHWPVHKADCKVQPQSRTVQAPTQQELIDCT